MKENKTNSSILYSDKYEYRNDIYYKLGEIEKTEKIARKMLDQEKSIDEVSEFTGLYKERVEGFYNELLIKRAKEKLKEEGLDIPLESYTLYYDKVQYKRDLNHELGETETAKKIAKKMLAKGKPIEEIIEFTDLSKEEIENL